MISFLFLSVLLATHPFAAAAAAVVLLQQKVVKNDSNLSTFFAFLYCARARQERGEISLQNIKEKHFYGKNFR